MAKLSDQTILITGCSTGIGRRLVLDFAGAGNRVFATARRLESIEDLAGERIEVLPLDVTDGASMKRAVEEVVRRAGGVDMLVNNAGFGLMGPVAELDLDDIRRQFETNVIGPIALTQLVLPYMVRTGRGRIVNIGSVSGITTAPYGGAYSASKAALHLFSEALRMEVAPFGVEVIVVQPGGIQSDFGKTAASLIERFGQKGSLYEHGMEGIETRARMSQKISTPVEEFSSRMVDAVLKIPAPYVFRAGHGSALLPALRWLLPTGVRNRIMGSKFKLDNLKGTQSKSDENP